MRERTNIFICKYQEHAMMIELEMICMACLLDYGNFLHHKDNKHSAVRDSNIYLLLLSADLCVLAGQFVLDL